MNPSTETQTEVGRAVLSAPRSDAPISGGAPGTARPTFLAPETVHLALQQLHAALKKSGAAQSENLITGEETGYAQLVATLEKLSKMALDWEERRKAETQIANAKPPGFSQQTEFELAQKFEGPPPPPTPN